MSKETIAKWREDIETGLTSIGINPTNTLAKYDHVCETDREKGFLYASTQRHIETEQRKGILRALGCPPKTEESVSAELVAIGIYGKLEYAGGAVLALAWKSLREQGVLS